MTRSNEAGTEKLGPASTQAHRRRTWTIHHRTRRGCVRTSGGEVGGLAFAVVAVAASLPQMARAQQSGLFPLHPIKRHRVPCDQEDPIYKINKYQYFGYNPTCWHRFPDGWGCPSPNAPDREASLKETPLGSRAEGELPPGGAPAQPEMENAPIRPRGGLPEVPRGESPFDQPSGSARGRSTRRPDSAPDTRPV